MYASVPMVMVNYGKEYVTATRNGKHLKFYSMKTDNATDILKFPDTLRSVIGDDIATNANGTMMSILMHASTSYFNRMKVVVIDVETRKMIKILISRHLDISGSFRETMLLPNNGSFIAVAGNDENEDRIMYLWDLSQGLITEKNLVIKKVITDHEDLDQEVEEKDSDSDMDSELEDEEDEGEDEDDEDEGDEEDEGEDEDDEAEEDDDNDE